MGNLIITERRKRQLVKRRCNCKHRRIRGAACKTRNVDKMGPHQKSIEHMNSRTRDKHGRTSCQATSPRKAPLDKEDRTRRNQKKRTHTEQKAQEKRKKQKQRQKTKRKTNRQKKRKQTEKKENKKQKRQTGWAGEAL